MKISTAYDAFWFLTEHPKMKCREAQLIPQEEVKSFKPGKGERLRTVTDDMPWAKEKTYLLHEFVCRLNAFPVNLDIYYTKVDQQRKVNKDTTNNKFVECWLEFGPIEKAVSDGEFHTKHYHDPRLDCGAPTFDQALVKLARLVRKHYGDFHHSCSIKD